MNNSFDGTWIEAGMNYGVNPNNTGGSFAYFFEAGNNPTRGYAETDFTSARPTINSNPPHYAITIMPNDSYSFNYQSGIATGTTGGWPKNYLFNVLQAGSESTQGAVADYHGGMDGLQWYSKNNNLVSGWAYGSQGTANASDPGSWGYVNPQTANVSYTNGVSYPC